MKSRSPQDLRLPAGLELGGRGPVGAWSDGGAARGTGPIRSDGGALLETTAIEQGAWSCRCRE